ncbi:MAG: ATPase, T2SS/T4P/T4SS family [Candidatus Micrarchaeia archaeon]
MVELPKYLFDIETELLRGLKGRFVGLTPAQRFDMIKNLVATINPILTVDELKLIEQDMLDLGDFTPFLQSNDVEDIMINNTKNVFVYDSRKGNVNTGIKFKSQAELERFVRKLELYATNETISDQILDVHLPFGSRVNIVSSPLGYDITIRNSKREPLSILDLINRQELDYRIAARLWLYTEGLHVKPANILIGGMPASGKTTLLNSLFSFYRPEERVITIEETYELNTSTQENCVNLETNQDMPLITLVNNALRMRPDIMIIGEVRGPEANDMITAMNVGKICVGTIHASSSRDVINRLQHFPMNVPKDIIPVIDAIIIVSPIYIKNTITRKITQISEISGIEDQVLLSDLYVYDYKSQKGSPIMPSVTYRDNLSKLLGISPMDIVEEERARALLLEKMNNMNLTKIEEIHNVVEDYYKDPVATLEKFNIKGVKPIVQ